MLQHPVTEDLPEQRRKEIFHLIVVAQDLEMTVSESREMIRARYGLSEHKVRQIEREGLLYQWPPL
jgi:hypothetical protein